MYANISLCAPTVEKPFRENAPKYSDAPSIYTIYTIILQFVPYVYTHIYIYIYIYISTDSNKVRACFLDYEPHFMNALSIDEKGRIS